MDTVTYAILAWKLGPEAWVGRLVGEDGDFAASSTKKLCELATKHVRAALEGDDFLLAVPLDHPALVVQDVNLRPAWRKGGSRFPSARPMRVPVCAVHGESDSGRVCHLPLLGAQFHFEHDRELELLVDVVTRDALHDSTPDAIHRLLLLPPQELFTITLDAVRRRRRKGLDQGHSAESLLSTVADPMPPGRAAAAAGAAPQAAWEREEIIADVTARLSGERANVLLIGEPGVGKSAILSAAVAKFHALRDPATERRRRAWRTTAHRLIAHARYLGEWQQTCDAVTEALAELRDVLWVSDVSELLRTGGSPMESVAAYLAPAMDDRRLQIVGEMTARQLDVARALLPAFISRFQVVHVPELDRAAVLRVLAAYAVVANQSHGTGFEREALEAAYRVLDRHVRYEQFPGKAVKFLGTLARDAMSRKSATVKASDVVEAFVKQSGLPEVFLRDDVALRRDDLRAHFAKHIVGQEAAVERLCDVVLVYKAGMNDPRRPLSTLLLAGPTGVGKTASARALAEYFYGAGQRSHPLIRLDMSEYQSPAQLERLIGSSAGEPGRFLQQIREKPFSVLLLDEIEKAHPAFFDVLMNVLDEGVLVDAYGRVTDFRNSIIVMTSNLGSTGQGSLGFGGQPPDRHDAAIRTHFRPEFFNRIDHVLIYRRLTPDVVLQIARKELESLRDREGFRRRKLTLEFTEPLIAHLAEIGFDPAYGARPLQRAIERLVVGPLAKRMLDDKELKGRTLRLGWRAGALNVELA